MMEIRAGEPLIQLIMLAYAAGIPVMLCGPHGVGKSELLKLAAAALGIGYIERDLSIMEPTDLVGIPQVGEDQQTHFRAPAFLPRAGDGLIVFEELNRSPRYMQSPCLQLLTTRTLNDYILPKGWLLCASINEAEDGYFVEQLDAALLSRFLLVRVVPDVTQWVRYAREEGQVHTAIVGFVEHSPNVFDDPAANPRAWTYASTLLKAWEQGESNKDLLSVSLAGLLGETWAVAFLQYYANDPRPLSARQIIDAFPAHTPSVRQWVSQTRLDLMMASLEHLKRYLQPQRAYEAVIQNQTKKRNVEAFFALLPADVKTPLKDWLKGRNFNALRVPKGGK